MSGFVGNIIVKDPAAILTYGLAWSDWLNGDTLADAVWTIPAGLTNVGDSINSTAYTDIEGTAHLANTVAFVKLSGGTAGSSYTCVCHITTAAGDEDDRSIIVAVSDR